MASSDPSAKFQSEHRHGAIASMLSLDPEGILPRVVQEIAGLDSHHLFDADDLVQDLGFY